MNTSTLNKYLADGPLVTVITVTYNSALYVRDAIESVLAQTYDHFELIIGDDCSTDDTWKIIQEYKDDRIIAYRNEKNIGEYPNRNKAISKASGKYLTFIDGDDILYPHALAIYTEQAEAFPEAAYAVQKNYTNNIVYPLLLKPTDILKNFYFGKSNLLTASFACNFFRTDLVRSMGGLSEDYVTSDEHVRLNLAAQYPVLFIQGWLSWPRETPGQASSRIYDGTGLVELMQITKNMVESGKVGDKNLGRQMEISIQKKAADFIFSCLKRGQFKKINKVLTCSPYPLGDIFKSIWTKITIQDPLKKYHPANPLISKAEKRTPQKIF
jgi:glycosyltransferase involved in cell wall biosynthesis